MYAQCMCIGSSVLRQAAPTTGTDSVSNVSLHNFACGLWLFYCWMPLARVLSLTGLLMLLAFSFWSCRGFHHQGFRHPNLCLNNFRLSPTAHWSCRGSVTRICGDSCLNNSRLSPTAHDSALPCQCLLPPPHLSLFLSEAWAPKLKRLWTFQLSMLQSKPD